MPSTRFATSSVSSRKWVIAEPAEPIGWPAWTPPLAICAASMLARSSVCMWIHALVQMSAPWWIETIRIVSLTAIAAAHHIVSRGVAAFERVVAAAEQVAADRGHREEHDEQEPAEPELLRSVLGHAPRERPHVRDPGERQVLVGGGLVVRDAGVGRRPWPDLRFPVREIDVDGHDVTADRVRCVDGILVGLAVEREREQTSEAAVVVTDEVGAVAVFDDAPVVEHDDLVDRTQRRQPVRDHERGPAADQLDDGRLQSSLGLGVDASGGLVEHDDVRIAQPDPRQGEELGLARREPGPRRAEFAVDAARRERTQADPFERVDHGAHRSARRRTASRCHAGCRRTARPPAGRAPRGGGVRPGGSRRSGRRPARADRRSARRVAAPDARTWSCRCRCGRRCRPSAPPRCAGRPLPTPADRRRSRSRRRSP